MYYYNKELFAKANARPPLNWNELIDTCRTLKTAGITPIAANWLFQVPQWIAEIHFDQYHVDWAQVVRAQKGDWNYDPAIDDKFAFDAASCSSLPFRLAFCLSQLLKSCTSAEE